MRARPLEPDPETALGYRPPSGRPSGPIDCLPVDETFLSNHLAPAFGDPQLIDGRWWPATLNRHLGDKPTYGFSTEYEATWRPEARRMLLVRLAALVERARQAETALAEQPQLVIKETNGSHAADLVASLLPGSRMLLLIRDGRDVVDSLLDAYAPDGFLARSEARTEPLDRAERLDWAARLWACNSDASLRALADYDPARSRILRYEDLLSDPQGELTGLFDWLGLTRSPERIARIVSNCSFEAIPADQRGPGKRARSARVGTWRDNLSVAESARLDQIFGPLLDRFGYAR